MESDIRMLEVSSSSLKKLKEESMLVLEVVSKQLVACIRQNIVDIVLDCLVLDRTGSRRQRCAMLAVEPKPQSADALRHITEIVSSLVEGDVERVCSQAAAYLNQLASLQLSHCTEVFVPALTDAHRFVVDQEIKGVFDLLRLQQALMMQESTSVGLAQPSASGDDAPLQLQKTIVVAPSHASCLDDDIDGDGGVATSPNVGFHPSDSFRRLPGATPEKSRSLHHAGSLARAPTVVSFREHTAALQRSFAREKELHHKVSAMQRALQERAAKEQESVELLTRRMQAAQEAATVEMQAQLSSFESQLTLLTEENAALKDRLLRTCEVVGVLDELCGKLNSQVLVQKEILIREGCASALHARIEGALEELRTTHCCRGVPLAVGGGWLYGEVPPTKEWMKELGIGAASVPSETCLAQQHDLLAKVLQGLSTESENKLLQCSAASLTARLQQQKEGELQKLHVAKTQFMRQEAVQRKQLDAALQENAKLREAIASHISCQSLARSKRSDNANAVSVDEATYMELLRCKRERNEVLARLALLEGSARPPQESDTFAARPDDSTPDALDLIARRLGPQVRVALTARPRSAAAVPRRVPRPPSPRNQKGL